ncbi:MAG: hypothetical protein KDA42_12370 [Planctomycetales bacterium]|nr:hypothetical protein [Planctomycetales bacterium]
MSQVVDLPQTTPASRPAMERGGARPPLIIAGGETNALSIARCVASLGVDVYALNTPDSYLRYSRHCRLLGVTGGENLGEAWYEYLMGPATDYLQGAVLLAASDVGIEMIARHRAELEKRFILDLSDVDAQLTMLNKLKSYDAAIAAGVPTPRHWRIGDMDQLASLRSELVYPLLVKPTLSHIFTAKYKRKFLVVENYEELIDAITEVAAAGIDAVLMEKIPGPDSLLCSYYTYLDEHGHPLFDFTKRIIRRYPENEGPACYHITDHVPAVREVALRLFQHVGLRGVANAEFKLDERDGQLKLIESNARFTAANCLVTDAGLDLAQFVYCRLANLPTPRMDQYRAGVRLWYPLDDLRAFLELRRKGKLTAWQWMRSLCHRQTFPIFRLRDSGPSVAFAAQFVCRTLRKLFLSKENTDV